MSSKAGYIVGFFLISAVVVGLPWFRQAMGMQKYDLDMCLVLDSGEYSETATSVLLKSGSSFDKSICRLYKLGSGGKVLAHFINPDSSDADYFIPYSIATMQIDSTNDDLLYQGRRYSNATEYRVFYDNDIGCFDKCAIVQLIQPPPASKFFVFMDMAQFLQALAVFTAVFLYFNESYKERMVSQRSGYMQVEFEAINVFRFELEHRDVVYWVYDESHEGSESISAQDVWATQEYVCQILNLFEIVVERARENALSMKIYNTWVRWFWDLSSAKNFKHIWSLVSDNYTDNLQKRIGIGLAISDGYRDDCSEDGTQILERALQEIGWPEYREAICQLDKAERKGVWMRAVGLFTPPPPPAP